MTSNDESQSVVDRYYAAMQAQRAGEADLISLFAEDAVYIEPWTGQPVAHTGVAAIREYIHASLDQSPPDLSITVHRVDVDGSEVAAEWTCESPALPAPMKGKDQITVRNGRIVRLETSLIGGPSW